MQPGARVGEFAMKVPSQDGAKFRPYVKPLLTVYGSVRSLTGGSLAVGTDTGFPAGKNTQSDRRLKDNIVRIDTHPAGFGLYLFDYKSEFHGWLDAGRQFGVMADEVEAIVPEAVSRDEDGYARVNYAMLGITRH